MGKRFYNDKLNFNDSTGVLPISKGGTGGKTAEEAQDLLQVVKREHINAPGGVLGLNASGKVPLELLPENVGVVEIIITGNADVPVSTSGTFTIVNYSSFSEYTVSASVGSVSRSGDTITYVAPATPQSVTMTVNDTEVTINVVPVTAYISTPSITSPTAGATNLGPDVAFTGSAFVANGGSDTHESSSWQVATDAAFTNIVASAVDSSTAKLAWTATGLAANTTYYTRTRYKGVTIGYSNWSSTRTISTKTAYGVQGLEEAILSASDKSNAADFGFSVSITSDGTRVIVGATAADPGGVSDAGAAYVYVRSGSTWTQEAILSASDKATSAYFGTSVSITSDGSRVIVGARIASPGGVGSAGAAYVYVRSGAVWTQEAILTASDKSINAYFGYSVCISSDASRVVVGGYRADPGGVSDAGAAYVYVRSGTTWTQEAILTASDKSESAYFGWSVSITGDGSRVIAGARLADPGGVSDAGAAYVYVRSGSTWTQEAILSASDKNATAYFGYSVSITSDGSRVIVGAMYADPGGVSDAGAAYVFVRSGTTWTQEAILTASNKSGSAYFGTSVSITSDGSRVVVGAYSADPGGVSDAGAAYVYVRSGTTWTQKAILTASNKTESDQFGRSVSITDDGSRVIAGAYAADVSGIGGAGTAYVFS